MSQISDFYVVTLESYITTDGYYVLAENRKDIQRKQSYRGANQAAYAHCERPMSIAAAIWYGDKILKHFLRRGAVYITDESRPVIQPPARDSETDSP